MYFISFFMTLLFSNMIFADYQAVVVNKSGETYVEVPVYSIDYDCGHVSFTKFAGHHFAVQYYEEVPNIRLVDKLVIWAGREKLEYPRPNKTEHIIHTLEDGTTITVWHEE